MPCNCGSGSDAQSRATQEIEIGRHGCDREGGDHEAEGINKDDDPLLGGFDLVLGDEPHGHRDNKELADDIKRSDH